MGEETKHEEGRLGDRKRKEDTRERRERTRRREGE
jgi:hypothetical protein